MFPCKMAINPRYLHSHTAASDPSPEVRVHWDDQHVVRLRFAFQRSLAFGETDGIQEIQVYVAPGVHMKPKQTQGDSPGFNWFFVDGFLRKKHHQIITRKQLCIPKFFNFQRSLGPYRLKIEELLHREKKRKTTTKLLQLGHTFSSSTWVWRSLCHLKICFEFLSVEMVKSGLSSALNIEPPNAKLLHRMSRTGGAVWFFSKISKVSWGISSVNLCSRAFWIVTCLGARTLVTMEEVHEIRRQLQLFKIANADRNERQMQKDSNTSVQESEIKTPFCKGALVWPPEKPDRSVGSSCLFEMYFWSCFMTWNQCFKMVSLLYQLPTNHSKSHQSNRPATGQVRLGKIQRNHD